MDTNHRARSGLLLLACLLGLSTGCEQIEKLTGGGDGEKDPAPEAKAETPETEAQPEVKKLDPKEAELEALRAEAEAAKEQLAAANAANKELQDMIDAPPEAEDAIGAEKELGEGEKGPVSLAGVKLTNHKAEYGHAKDRFQIKASVDVTVNEAKKGGLYAKATCAVGDEVAVDVVTFGNQYSDFGKLAAGDKSTLEKTFFARDGLGQQPSKCQVTFDYGLSEFSLHLQDSCWDGKAVKDGACEGIAAKPEGEGKLVPYAFDVSFNKPLLASAEDDPRRSLMVRYHLRVNEPVDHALHMYLKTSCKVGDKTWVEVNPDYPHVKPFKFKPGEMVPLGHGQFIFNPLPGEPESCQFAVQLAEAFDKPAETVRAVCFEGGELTEEPCNPPPEGLPERAPVTPDALELDNVTAQWQPGIGNKGVRLNLLFAANLKKPVEKFTRLYAAVTCDGKSDKEHATSMDLSQLDPGESALLSVPAFLAEPLSAEPKACEVKIKAGARSDAAIEVGQLCIKGSEAKVGSCKSPAKKKKKKAQAKPKDDKKPADSKSDDKKPNDTKPGDDNNPATGSKDDKKPNDTKPGDDNTPDKPKKKPGTVHLAK